MIQLFMFGKGSLVQCEFTLAYDAGPWPRALYVTGRQSVWRADNTKKESVSIVISLIDSNTMIIVFGVHDSENCVDF